MAGGKPTDAGSPATPRGTSPRPLPAIDCDNRPYWTGGQHGELLICRCRQCRHYVHPPTTFCPRCECRELAPEPVSGYAEILSLTVNHRAWFPGLAVPYVVAMVGIEEQPDIHLITNVVDCDPEAVQIGDRVKVRFEPAEDLWVPLFAPVSDIAESRCDG